MEELKNKKIYIKVKKALEQIANDEMNNTDYAELIEIKYDIYKTLLDYLDLKEKDFEKLTDYLYDLYFENEFQNISIDDMIYPIQNMLEDGNSVDDILKFTVNDYLGYIA